MLVKKLSCRPEKLQEFKKKKKKVVPLTPQTAKTKKQIPQKN